MARREYVMSEEKHYGTQARALFLALRLLDRYGRAVPSADSIRDYLGCSAATAYRLRRAYIDARCLYDGRPA
jgi:hypothetical protein